MDELRIDCSLPTVVALAMAGLVASCSASRESTIAPVRDSGRVHAGDGTAIYYEKVGSGPAVLLIHGLAGNHAVWYRQVPDLARDHTVVILSQRGFAPSDGEPAAYPLDTLIADAVAVLDALELEEVDVVGQSMGGWTALGLALHHPDRIRTVVLADSVAGITDDVIAEHHHSMVARARRLRDEPPRLGVHQALDSGFSRDHPEEAYLYQLLASFGAPSPAAIAGELAATGFDEQELGTNRVPTLFVVGERDPIFPVAIVRRAASLLPHARVVVIGDAGHSPYFERPQRWNAVVREFIDNGRRAEPVPLVRRNTFREQVGAEGARPGISRRARTTGPQPR